MKTPFKARIIAHEVGAMAMAAVFVALALETQAAECVSGPAVKLKVSSAGTSVEPASRLILRQGSGPVYFSVRAKFYPGMGCPDLATSPGCWCSHDPVSFTFSITGPEDCAFTGKERIDNSEERGYFVINDGFGEFTITAETEGLDEEGTCGRLNGKQLTHTGNHGGASASKKVRVWGMELTATPTTFERGAIVSISAAFLGGVTPISTCPFYWESSTGIPNFPKPKQRGIKSIWEGPIVCGTDVKLTAYPQNPYAPEYNQDPNVAPLLGATQTVHLTPQRRADWVISIPTIASEGDASWQSDSNPLCFPVLSDFKALGQNTNVLEAYRLYSSEWVTPIYTAGFLTENPWEGKAEAVETGPNKDIWYNTDRLMYKIERMSRFNEWVKPDSTFPTSAPGLEFNWVTFFVGLPDCDNWLFLQQAITGYACDCPIGYHQSCGPLHRWLANKNHEENGPDGLCLGLLGHQIIVESAVRSQPSVYDVIYKIEGNLSARVPGIIDDPENDLRNKNETVRAYVVASDNSNPNGLFALSKQLDCATFTVNWHNYLGAAYVYRYRFMNGSSWEWIEGASY